MTSKSKVLDFIFSKLKRLETYWRQDLEDMNIWEDVSEIYRIIHAENKAQATELEANTILAFIVLAYDNRSSFLDAHKDRFDNKLKIMTRLAGPSAMTNDLYADAVYGQGETINEVINWYVNYQKDSRWKRYIAGKEYASQATAYVMQGLTYTKNGIDPGRMFEIAERLDKSADILYDILRQEYLNLDTVLEKEKRPKVTDMDSYNFMSHEAFIFSRDRRVMKDAEEKIAEKEALKN